MKHTYSISGMSCNGCRSHVEKTLSTVDGVEEVQVDLQKAEATITMGSHISIDIFKGALEKDSDGRYGISVIGEHNHKVEHQHKSKKPQGKGTGVFYCPMHCEGDETYDKPGDCPVCGMDLVEEVSSHTEGSSEDKTYEKLVQKFWLSVAFTLPIFIIAMSEMIPDNPIYEVLRLKHWNWVQFGLSIPVVFYTTWMFFVRAYRSVKTSRLNMFTLIGIGAGVAWVFSVFAMLFPNFFPPQFKTELGTVHVYFEAATVILTLVLMGQVLEARAHNKTNSAVKELLKLAPNKAIRIVDGKEEEISIDDININDVLRVKPGEKIPVDGSVFEGESTIDESMITGEPVPVHKISNDKVSAGTINGNQSFTIKAEKIGADTLLSQIIEMVNNASRTQAPIQKVADKISAYFVPIVVLISVITFILWAVFGPEPKYVFALVNAIAVLIIACPCALGLATPMSVMVGVGKGAKSGVLIKNAEALERLNTIDILVIDKTGTITEGKPSVEKIDFQSTKYNQNDVLQFIISLNQLSEHPLAEATIKFGKAKGVEPLKVSNFESITGRGVIGSVEGKKLALGNEKLMQDNEVVIPDELLGDANKEQKLGKTISFLSIDNVAIGYVVITDKIKETSKNAISELQSKGIEILMLTGDNEYTARAVSDEVGLNDFQSDMLPQDKMEVVKQLQESGKRVAVAGDGINDAPALAKADVGIAMGTGSDVAIESASITLVKGDLRGIVKAHNLSNKVMRNIKQNLFFALIYNSIGVPIAAGVLFPFFGILLSPMLAALAMSFSSVSVITNALRLRHSNI